MTKSSTRSTLSFFLICHFPNQKPIGIMFIFAFLSISLLTSVLAVPTTPNPSQTLKLLSKRRTIDCFDSIAHAFGSRVAPRIADCVLASESILCEVDSVNYVPIRFWSGGRAVGTDAQLPLIWTHGTCSIYIDIFTPRVVDRATLLDIALRAAEIINQCVRGDNGLGGGTTVGARDLIDVFVWGVSKDDHPESKPTRPTRQTPVKPLPKPGPGMAACSLHMQKGGFWNIH